MSAKSEYALLLAEGSGEETIDSSKGSLYVPVPGYQQI